MSLIMGQIGPDRSELSVPESEKNAIFDLVYSLASQQISTNLGKNLYDYKDLGWFHYVSNWTQTT